MFERLILKELNDWKKSFTRKPLIIRGARQVGKTSLIQEFSKSYQEYIYLNLERKEEANLFENYSTFSKLVEEIFFLGANRSIFERDSSRQ